MPTTSAPPKPPPRRRAIVATLLLFAQIVALIFEWQWLAPPAAADVSAAAGISLSGATAAPNSNQPRLIPFTDVNPYGVNIFLQDEVEDYKKELTMQQVSDLGAGWVKQQFPWDELEFSKGKFFDEKNNKDAWQKFDQIVALAEKYHLRIIARLDRAPAWARPPGSSPGAPPSNLSDYADFVAAFIKHYRGRINFIQVWNEPNLTSEWDTGKPVDPAAYAALLKAAYQRVKQVDPNVVVLAAPLAMTTEQTSLRGNMEDISYLSGMYAAGAAPYFDILAANGYGLNDPPDKRAAFDRLNFGRASLMRAVMAQNHDELKPVWFDEYGWNAAPDSIPPDQRIWGQVSREQQATYTVQGIEGAARQWDWAGVFNIWYFRQVGTLPPTSAEYYFDMVNVDFTREPVYGAVQATAHHWQVAGAGYHEELSGGVQPNATWPLRLNKQASGGAYLQVPVAGATSAAPLRLTFVGNKLDLITYGDVGTLYPLLDGGSDGLAADLPHDANGPYIRASGSQTITVVSGTSDQLPLQQHVLTLRAAEPGATGGLDAYIVGAARSYILFYALSGALALTLLATLLYLRRSLRRTAQ